MEGMLGVMAGMKVFVDPNLPRFKMVQFRFPRSKSRRIRKKFTKDNANFKQVPFKSAFVLHGDTVVIHPDDFRLIREKVQPIPKWS